MTIHDSETGFPIGDPETPPLREPFTIEKTDLEEAFSSLILSSSGWRKVFASDGDEGSTSCELDRADQVLVARMADVFATFCMDDNGHNGNTVIVGCDTRYTGPAIADIMIRVFLSRSMRVEYLFITPVPEIMAYTRTVDGAAGFAYISASHNPIGHNGLKFGDSTGRIIGGEDSTSLIRLFSECATVTEDMEDIIDRVNRTDPNGVYRVFSDAGLLKQKARTAYEKFSREVISDSRSEAYQKRFFSRIEETTRNNPIGVVAELNGSARTTSIDYHFLLSSGIRVKRINAVPRAITHQIVPEGEGLDLCKQELRRAFSEDDCFVFGYVPDNDGDRGNIVYIDETTGAAESLEAQQVFALACVAELSSLVYTGAVTYSPSGDIEQNVAVAVNGPTSLRIDRIAEAFGITIARCEVGEANVIATADSLRKRGYIVRLLGEGSNGGNITFPSTVRDPLNTLFALIKLLTIGKEGESPGLFHIWCEKSGQVHLLEDEISLEKAISSLPKFSTTSVFEPRGALSVRVRDHRSLKVEYERIFTRRFDSRRAELARRFGINSFEVVRYQGTRVLRGSISDNPEEDERGGYKILFKDANGRETAFLWMRGSKTEPVFRVMADAEGDDRERERYLLDWHVDMIREAEQACLGRKYSG